MDEESVTVNYAHSIGIHSSRPDSICLLGAINQSEGTSKETDDVTVLYSTGTELRSLRFNESHPSVLHSKFSSCAYHTGCVACIRANSRHVLSCDFDGQLILWDALSGTILDRVDVSSQSFSGYQLSDTDVKSRHLALSEDSYWAAVALEGAFTLVVVKIENDSVLTHFWSVSTCVEFVHFLPSGSANGSAPTLCCVRRNVPADVAKGFHSVKDLDVFGYRIDFYRTDSQQVTDTVDVPADDKLVLFTHCRAVAALLHRMSGKITFVNTESRKLLGIVIWSNLCHRSPVFYEGELKSIVSPGVILSLNPIEFFKDRLDPKVAADISLPSKQEVRSFTGLESWRSYECRGMRFEFVTKEVTDSYVAFVQIHQEYIVVFTQYEIVLARLRKLTNNQITDDVGCFDRRCLFNITCIGCACNSKFVAAGDFSGQVVVSSVEEVPVDKSERRLPDGGKKNETRECVKMWGCNSTIHGLYSAPESVRSLTWHPCYEEVLFMGLFSSQLVFVDVKSEHCVPALIDNVNSGAITCLKWSLHYFPAQPPPRLNIYSQTRLCPSESVHAAAILLAGTTSGHVVLYRHDFVFNRAELIAKHAGIDGEDSFSHIDCDMFVSSFTKLTTFLAHHPLESDDNFGSLGHFAEVWSCAWSPVGVPFAPQHFVTCSEDQQVRVWSLSHETRAANVDCSDRCSLDNDGDRDVSTVSSHDSFFREEKPVSCPVFVLTGHRFAVTCLDWQLLDASLSNSTFCHFLDHKDERESSEDVKTLTSFMASCSDDKSIRLYRVVEYFKVSRETDLSQTPERPSLPVESSDVKFQLLVLLSTAFLSDWHTLTYTCIERGGSHLAVVTQHGYLLVFRLSDADVIVASAEDDAWECVSRPKCCVYCKKVANGSLEGLAWSEDKLCMSSADCCLNVKSFKFKFS